MCLVQRSDIIPDMSPGPHFVMKKKGLGVLSCTCPKIRYYTRHGPWPDFVREKKDLECTHVLFQRLDIIPDMIPGSHFVKEKKDLGVYSCTCPKIRYYIRHGPSLTL